jgi:protein TonB
VAGAPLAFSPPLITAARFRRPPLPPDYPPRAVELDLNGTVLIRALLDPAGDPREVRVHRSSGHAVLDHAAVAAVSRWAFEPASRDGQRIPAWVEVPVHFRLH